MLFSHSFGGIPAFAQNKLTDSVYTVVFTVNLKLLCAIELCLLNSETVINVIENVRLIFGTLIKPRLVGALNFEHLNDDAWFAHLAHHKMLLYAAA